MLIYTWSDSTTFGDWRIEKSLPPSRSEMGGGPELTVQVGAFKHPSNVSEMLY